MDAFKQNCLPHASRYTRVAVRVLMVLTVIVALLAVVPNWLSPAFGLDAGFPVDRQVDEPAAAVLAERTPTSIQITSIIANLVVRLAAIAAGLCVVWLGHQSLLSGIKGEFQFDGRWAKLKGTSPGLLFVLLGCLAIGWALQAKHSGARTTEVRETTEVDVGAAPPRVPLIPAGDTAPQIPPIPVDPPSPVEGSNDEATQPE